MRIIFAGTPEFAVAPLRALISEHHIVAVFTQPDRRSGRGKKLTAPPVKTAAIEHDIPVFQPSSLSNQAQTIADMRADVMVVVAYGMLLPQNILDIPRLGCINIHASILPRWRGAAPIQRAIEAGDLQTGVSIMQMAAGLDTGAVYEIFNTDICATDTSESLHHALSLLGAKGIVSTLAKLSSKPDFKASEQDESKASYAKKILKTEANIDWSENANCLDAKIRAFVPWPICQSHHLGNKIRIWKASIKDSIEGLDAKKSKNVPGTVVAIEKEGVVVACTQGYLRLEVLQKDGGKALPFDQFSNGYTFSLGDKLSYLDANH